MSLNWKEIDLVLGELPLAGAHIQQIVQPDFRNLYFQIYQPADRFWLRVCLETGQTRLHRSPAPAQKPAKRQRFAQLLHSRIKGGRITAARQINSDRIVRIDVVRASEETTLWIRLWGGASNMIATESDGAVLDAFFRRPKRGEVSGGTYTVADDANSTGNERFESRFRLDAEASTGSINDQIEAFYRESAEQSEHELLLAAATRILTHRESRLESQIEKAERRVADAGDADRQQLFGDLITASLHAISPGDHWLQTEDYTNENAPISIELDPALSPLANAAQFYDRARKARRRGASLSEEISNLHHRLEATRMRISSIAETDPEELREIAREAAPANRAEARTGQDVPGLVFSAGGFTILVGRNSRENDQLLRHHVKGNDLWLHTRDYPGGYVFVRAQKGKSVPLEVLLDAGNLAVHYSKAKANGRAELYYTHVKYLRRAKGGPVGLVLPTHERNLSIVTDAQRISRLMS